MEHFGAPTQSVSKTNAARISGLSLSTIRRLVARGILEEVRIAEGMHPRLRLADVLALSGGDAEVGAEQEPP